MFCLKIPPPPPPQTSIIRMLHKGQLSGAGGGEGGLGYFKVTPSHHTLEGFRKVTIALLDDSNTDQVQHFGSSIGVPLQPRPGRRQTQPMALEPCHTTV